MRCFARLSSLFSYLCPQFSLRSKRFRGAREQRKSEKRDIRCPTPLFRFLALAHFAGGKNTENPVPRSVFVPKLHGNVRYAGYPQFKYAIFRIFPCILHHLQVYFEFPT